MRLRWPAYAPGASPGNGASTHAHPCSATRLANSRVRSGDLGHVNNEPGPVAAVGTPLFEDTAFSEDHLLDDRRGVQGQHDDIAVRAGLGGGVGPLCTRLD